MKSLNILLLEDSIDDAQNIINVLSKDYSITFVNTLQKAKDALANSRFDLSIIDIYLGNQPHGIEFAKHLRSHDQDIPFIFLTALRSKTTFEQAKHTQPYTYLLKPFNELELQYSIELAIEKQFQNTHSQKFNVDTSLLDSRYLFIKKGNKICKLDIENIEYVEAENNYSTLHTLTDKYAVRLSLSNIKEILIDANFEQIHRKFIVNINKLKEIHLSENTAYLTSGNHVTISERYKKRFSQLHPIIK